MAVMPCEVSRPVFVSADGVQVGPGRPSGCQLVDVEVQRRAPLLSICFRNYYTHTLSVLARGAGLAGAGGGEWRVCVGRHELMPDCHGEQGGEDCVVLSVGDLLGGGHLEGPVCLRLVLRQPSRNWTHFGVREVKCFTAPQRGHAQSRDVLHKAKDTIGSRDCCGDVSEQVSQLLSELVDLAAAGCGRGSPTARSLEPSDPTWPQGEHLLSRS